MAPKTFNAFRMGKEILDASQIEERTLDSVQMGPNTLQMEQETLYGFQLGQVTLDVFPNETGST